MDRLTVLEKELAKVKKELAEYRAFADEVSRPSDLYLRELAREVASGNRQALKDHNKRRW